MSILATHTPSFYICDTTHYGGSLEANRYDPKKLIGAIPKSIKCKEKLCSR